MSGEAQLLTGDKTQGCCLHPSVHVKLKPKPDKRSLQYDVHRVISLMICMMMKVNDDKMTNDEICLSLNSWKFIFHMTLSLPILVLCLACHFPLWYQRFFLTKENTTTIPLMIPMQCCWDFSTTDRWILFKKWTNYFFIITSSLLQGCPNYGPRAYCGPPPNFRWPAACL